MTSSLLSPTFVLRVLGATHIVLGVAHVWIWRLFGWTDELKRVSPLTARVFAVHTFFIAFVLVALGALAFGRPDLLVARSDFARLLLGTGVVFWLLRLVAQPVVFDPVLLRGSVYRWPVRAAAMFLFGLYVLAYGWALSLQLS